ncbi:DedA family protein [Piscinibacter koreensis]|uniref:DedA family protein n=1 Tax=Piscinibacter koreensis TaxID=2742824 RepID=A0A7Y6NMR6_9BURK|nr:DedA family protein [Schlegelella koreensis]NUZ06046.1 DedA family protein [Schlegelella koreensis]
MVDTITEFIADRGYVAIVLLMFAENVFPPIPSELIMPFAGFSAARGELHPVLVVLAGTAGSLLGGLPWFFAGRWWGAERVKRAADRHGRWLAVSRAEIESAEKWFDRYHAPVLVFGRLLPGVRTLIALPAGFSGMALAPFVVWSAVGSLLWVSLLTGAGYLMESRYGTIAAVLEPGSWIVFGAIVLAYLWRLVRQGRKGG